MMKDKYPIKRIDAMVIDDDGSSRGGLPLQAGAGVSVDLTT
jgi:hypothetical protein